MSHYSNSIDIRLTDKQYWDILKESDIELPINNINYVGQTDSWNWEGGYEAEDVFYSLIELLRDKAFIMATWEDSSTSEFKTWIYLGESTKKKKSVIFEKNVSLDWEDDYIAGEVELKDILRKWGVSFNDANPEILRLIGVHVDNYVHTEDTPSDFNTVFFGKYPQDSSDTNQKQPIEWIVLEEKKNKKLLLSKYILDYKPYNDSSNTDLPIWEDSDIRRWLNTEFMNEAFSDEEKIKIVPDKHGQNSIPSMNWCGSTVDNIFLLSFKDVESRFDLENEEEIAQGTKYAFSKGLALYGEEADFPDAEKTGCWMLRSGGMDGYVYVHEEGYIEDDDDVYQPCGIRPALWIEKA